MVYLSMFVALKAEIISFWLIDLARLVIVYLVDFACNNLRLSKFRPELLLQTVYMVTPDPVK